MCGSRMVFGRFSEGVATNSRRKCRKYHSGGPKMGTFTSKMGAWASKMSPRTSKGSFLATGIDFGAILMTCGVLSPPFFEFFPKSREPRLETTVTHFERFRPSKNLTFFDRKKRDFSCFFRNPSRNAFFEGPGPDLL